MARTGKFGRAGGEHVMRVMLDGRIVLPRMSGAGRYVVELARRLPQLEHDLHLEVALLPLLKRTGIPALLEDAGVRVVYCDVPVLSIRQWVAIPRLLRRLRPDLYHYPTLDLPYVGVRSVVTIYDLNPVLMPEYFARQGALRCFLGRKLLQGTLRRCRLAIVISDTVRRLIEQQFPKGRGKLRTVRLGVDLSLWSHQETGDGETPESTDERWGARPYVLYVGLDRPHKNLIRLVRAFARFRGSARWPDGAEPYLWLAGVGEGSRELRSELQQSGCPDSVRLTDALSDPSLIRAYRGARVAAYVSTSEGFGLPILEALAAGVPVVAGNQSSLPEVAGDAATYVTPTDETDIARGLTETWVDERLRRSLVERGARRVTEFSWDATARQTLQVYADALSQGR